MQNKKLASEETRWNVALGVVTMILKRQVKLVRIAEHQRETPICLNCLENQQ